MQRLQTPGVVNVPIAILQAIQFSFIHSRWSPSCAGSTADSLMISTSSGSSRRYQWTSPFCPALLFPLLRSTLLYSTPKSPYIGSFSTKFPLIRSEIQWAQLPVSGILETLKRELFFDLASSWGLWHEYIVDIYFGFYRGKGVVFGSLAVCFSVSLLMTYDFCCMLYLCWCAVVFLIAEFLGCQWHGWFYDKMNGVKL